ncbi:ankyrin repeat domain-containing protein 12-like isoform X2 [Ptychodera flava]|uniref:ankyrin repeat domain-containing protein 12-like isoform X2 n=1 Tax=Ptychodera flava TaxID=63121 RepID=UPI00396A2612
MDCTDTKLHEAVRYGDTNLVLEALKEDFDPNQIGLYQWSCVHEAANNGDLEILEMLLEYNGDPNARDQLHGSTAVHYAAKEGHVECLQALVDAGGKYDISNDDGENCLDVAVGKCKQILDKQRVRKLMRLSPKDARKEIILETEKHGKESQEKCDVVSIPERQDHTGKKAWDEIEVISSVDLTEKVDNDHEHENKEEEKSLIETVLPKLKGTTETKIEDIKPVIQTQNIEPFEASMISKVYIKSYLLPDKKGETKRRTEEHKVEEAERTKQSIITVKRQDGESTKAIFQPSRFKFTKPLEYKKVSKEMVETRTVHLSVCVKQKYSNRSFIIANCQIDLKSAVRKLKREYFKLTSCINPTIPSNLHLYSPNDLVVVNQGLYSNITASDPNLRLLSVPSLHITDDIQRASSEGNLREVKCQSVESIPSIAIDIPNDDEHSFAQTLQEIAVMPDGRKYDNISRSHPELTAVDMPLPGASVSTESNQLQNVLVMSDKSSSSPDVRISSQVFREVGTESIKFGKSNTEDILKVEDLDEEEIVGERITEEERHKRKTSPKPGRAVDVSRQLIQVQVHSTSRDDDIDSTHLSGSSFGSNKPTFKIEHVDESPSKTTPPQRKKHMDHEKTNIIANTRDGLQFSQQSGATPKLIGFKMKPDSKKKASITESPSQHSASQYKENTQRFTSQETMATELKFTKPLTHGIPQTTLSLDLEQTIPTQRGEEIISQGGNILGTEQTILSQGSHHTKHKYDQSKGSVNQDLKRENKDTAVTPKRPHRYHRKKRGDESLQSDMKIQGKEKETYVSEDLKKKLATPEFRLKMFQRTGKEPHPATPGMVTDINTSETDQSDPFFVPGTPVQSPQANQQAEARENVSSTPPVSKELKEFHRIESPAISRIKASWI